MSISPMSFNQGQQLIQQNKQIIALLTEIRDQSAPAEEDPFAEEPAAEEPGAIEIEGVPILSVDEQALAKHIAALRKSGWTPFL